MVNVDKRIKPAEKQAASATVRRPRNQVLNSSIQQGKKISTKGKNPFTKLNSSKLNCSVIDGKTYEEARKILTSGDDNYEYLWDYFNEYMTKLGDEIGKKVDIGFDVVADDFFNTMADTPDENQFYEKMRALGEQYGEDLDSSLDATDASTDTSAENDTDLDSGCGSENKNDDANTEKLNSSEDDNEIYQVCQAAIANVSLPDGYRYTAPRHSDGGVVMTLSKDVDGQSRWVEKVIVTHDPESGAWEFSAYEPEADLGSNAAGYPETTEEAVAWLTDELETFAEYMVENPPARISRMNSNLNCSEEETKIVTESGNEVSLSDIQIIQDPNTNEIALFIQEDPDEAIPEGFTVIGVASQPALPAVDGEGAVCPECGQDPCVCEGGENLDSSADPRQSC